MADCLEHSAVQADDATHIHPWDAVRTRLGQEFDSNPCLFDKAKSLLMAKVDTENYAEVTNAQSYFACLEKHFEHFEVLEHLIYLTEHLVSLHIEMGTVNMSDLLKRLKRELGNIQQRLEDDGLLENRTFVGREQYIKEISKSLIEDDFVKGVCICGLGGIGKTSLAKKICYDLSKHWTIYLIDLREKHTLVDLLRAILDAYQQTYSHGDCEGDLEEQLLTLLKGITNQKQILLFDNVDGIIMREGEAFQVFLDNFLQTLNRIGTSCMVKVIITSRYKLTSQNTQQINLQFNGRLLEIELQSLSQEESLRLYDNFIHEGTCFLQDVSFQIRKQIVDLCGYSPLAIRIITDAIKRQHVTAKQIISNLKSKKIDENMPRMSLILQTSFDVLKPFMQKQLIQLSIFKAAPFDIYAAAEVLGADKIGKNTPDISTAKLTLVYLGSLHLVEIDKSLSNYYTQETASPGSVEYSLNPLVSKFLVEKSKQDPFRKDIQIAQERFVAHFKAVVNKVGELEEKNFCKAQSIVEKHRVHLQTFFYLLQSSSEYHIQGLKANEGDILTLKRIVDLVALMVDDYERLVFIEKAYLSAIDRHDTLCSIFWLTHKGTLFYEMDRGNQVSIILESIEQMKKAIDIYDINARNLILGYYFYLRGRYFIGARNFEEALCSQSKAKELFCSVTSVKKNHLSSLARVYKEMGNIWSKRSPANLKEAKTCYEKSLELVRSLSSEDNLFRNLDIPCYLTKIGTCLYQEGVILSQQNDDPLQKYKDALQYYHKAIKIDIQMKMSESEDFANKLSRRAEVYATLGNFEEAEVDIKKSLTLRRSLLAPPHKSITLTTHKFGDILTRKAIFMNTNGVVAYKFLNVIDNARMYYEVTLKLIKNGGLDKNHPEYSQIKENHFWIEKLLNEPKQMIKIRSAYKKFEQGFYDKRIESRKSMSATIIDHMTREEKMKLFQSGDQRLRLIRQKHLKDNSDSEEDVSEEIEEIEENVQLLNLVDKQAECLERTHPTREQTKTQCSTSEERNSDTITENRSTSTRNWFFDDNSFVSFLENYVPSTSNEENESDFWMLLSGSDETETGGKVNDVQTTHQRITRERPSEEVSDLKKRKLEQNTSDL